MSELEVTTAEILTTVEAKKRSKVTKEKNTTETKIIPLPELQEGDRNIQLDVDFAQTKNMGNFESLRIGIKVSYPTTWDHKEVAYENICEWIKEKISSEYDEILQSKNSDDPFAD